MSRKRRGRSEASIYQRASDGLWVAVLSLGYDGKGKRKRKTVYGHTKKEVQDKLDDLRGDIKEGMIVGGPTLTVKQWLTRWLEITKPTVQPNTYVPYARHARLHLVPHLGHIKLQKLDAGCIHQLYATLTKAGVSPQLQRKI